MGTLERTETLTHRIGVNGRVSVKTIAGSLRVRGIDGEEARLTVRYRIRAGDQATAEHALDGGRVLLDRGPDWLEVETPERRLATGLAWLFGGARVSADISLEIPWGARVRLETMSGSIEAENLVGEQKYRTVSGDIRAWQLAGSVDAGAVSGSITLDGGGDIRLRANTVSGSERVRAARFHGTLLSTTSGGIAIVGALDPAGDHRAESISGSVDFTPLAGVTAELRSISGSIHSDSGARVDGGRGSWRAVVGDGSASLRVSSTSGSLRLHAPGRDDQAVRDGWRGTPAAPAGPVPPTAPTAPDAPLAPAAAAWGQGGRGFSTVLATGQQGGQDSATAPAPADATVPTVGAVPFDTDAPGGHAPAAETWNPDDTAEPEPDEQARADELTVLQALERGEIGVDEAAERLEILRGHGNV